MKSTPPVWLILISLVVIYAGGWVLLFDPPTANAPSRFVPLARAIDAPEDPYVLVFYASLLLLPN